MMKENRPEIPVPAAAGALSALLDMAGEALLVADAEGRIILVNDLMEEFLCRRREQLLGRKMEELSFQPEPGEVFRTGRSSSGEVVDLDGRRYVCDLRALTVAGRIAGVAACVRIPEIVEAEREAAEQEDLLKLMETILDSSSDGIVLVDGDARIALFNRAYCDFIGVKREDVLGRPVQDVIENTRMHIVLATGRAEVGEVQRIKGHDMVCSRIPLRSGDRVRAAVGKVMFRDVSELRLLLRRVNRLRTELEYLKVELNRHWRSRYSLDSIVGVCPRITELRDLAAKVALSDSTVLIQGESGTGKELFAHAIHNASRRSRRPFVRVNCAAVPAELLEAELFGYARGAFTGAREGGKTGKFELADSGTIFLDEVGDLPASSQAKLLRVLQEKEVERLGENRVIPVDMRVVAATNRNLEEMVRQRLFREDLYYRLNVVVLNIPPLREREGDIPVLADFMLGKISRRLGYPLKFLAPETMERLAAHHWPGNIRELENVLERVVNTVEGEVIGTCHLPLYLQRAETERASADIRSLRETVAEMEKNMILGALEATAGDCLAAARLLQLGKSTFYEKLSRYQIEVGKKV